MAPPGLGVAEDVVGEVNLRWGIRIPLRDGIHLNATLYLPPQQSAPAPTIFTLTPYVGQTYHDRGVYFAQHGFPFLTVDVRGRGNSAGTFEPFVNEGRDGYDIVEWLAQQPYCNGKVAMWGGSYGAYVQWATASECPPHLATIVPAASPYIGVDFPLRNNTMAPYVMQWLTLVAGRTSQDKIFSDNEFWGDKFRRWFESGAPFKTLDTQIGIPSAIFQEWLQHPAPDAYWDRCNPTSEQYAKITIPVLSITGSYDGDQPGALTHYREHLRNSRPEGRRQHYLVIGPWDHAGTRTPQPEFGGIKVGPASLVDLGKLHLQWYAWTLQGGPMPEFLRKPVAVYVMAADEWRCLERLEQATTRSERFYLHSSANPDDVFHSGQLSASPANSGPDHYVYDPRDIRHAAIESSVDPASLADQSMVHAATGTQLIYHSHPFETDTEITGFFKLTVWLSIDQADTDFGVTVYEIALDGSSVLLSTDTLRARYRESVREEKLVRTRDPLRYDFERFTFVSRRLPRGHRLRLSIGPLHSIYLQKNYNGGGVVAEESMQDARPVSVSLFHDDAHPSALYVPIGEP
jgi:hypothetical protein